VGEAAVAEGVGAAAARSTAAALVRRCVMKISVVRKIATEQS
jgi:hypothetical protein